MRQPSAHHCITVNDNQSISIVFAVISIKIKHITISIQLISLKPSVVLFDFLVFEMREGTSKSTENCFPAAIRSNVL